MAMHVNDRGTYVDVTRKSPFSGKEHTMSIPLSLEQFAACYNDWQDGTRIQYAFPNLTADQREFLMTGITPQEWESTFGKNDD